MGDLKGKGNEGGGKWGERERFKGWGGEGLYKHIKSFDAWFSNLGH